MRSGVLRCVECGKWVRVLGCVEWLCGCCSVVCGVVCSEVCGVVTVAVGRMWCGVRLQCVVLSGVVWGVCCGVCRVGVGCVEVMCNVVCYRRCGLVV